MTAPTLTVDRLSSRRRWLLLALVLTAGVLNYVDRTIISVLKPTISADQGWSEEDYGRLVSTFQAATAIALLGTGWLVDKLGVRLANPIGVVSWSLSAVAHGWASSFGQFVAARVALGATEAMGTPSGVKTIAAVLPPHQRSLGFGLSNALNSIGAIVAPLLIPVIALAYGWREAFILAGGAGLVWALAWWLAARGVRFADGVDAEPARATEDGADYGPVLRNRKTWTIAVAKFLSDATWWLLVFWSADIFTRQFGMTQAEVGAPVAIAFAGSALGSLAAGTVSTKLLAGGRSVDRVRKSVMLASALAVTPLPLILLMPSPWPAALLLALALGGHQGFSTSLFALITEITPRAKVARVTGFGAFCGNVAGLVMGETAGRVLGAGLGYLPLFLWAASAYLLALGWIALMLPRIEPVERSAAFEPTAAH